MKTSFLDYYKVILSKVSFDQQLFAKEYAKAINILEEAEVRHLDYWIATSGYKNLVAA